MTPNANLRASAMCNCTLPLIEQPISHLFQAGSSTNRRFPGALVDMHSIESGKIDHKCSIIAAEGVGAEAVSAGPGLYGNVKRRSNFHRKRYVMGILDVDDCERLRATAKVPGNGIYHVVNMTLCRD
jgi:hypothetical protein